MKKYVISLLMLLWSIPAFAGQTTIVNAGSDSGAFHQVLTMVGDKIDHTFVQADNPIIASTHFDKENVLTLWSTEWPGSMPFVEIDMHSIVAVLSYETILCSRKYDSMDELIYRSGSKPIKIATWGDSPAVKRFLDGLGIDFEIVPYGGSGDTVRGYLGKDADTIFTTQTKQSKVEADGTCFAFSAEGDLDFAFVDVLLAINADHDMVKSYRNVVSELIGTEAWQSAFGGMATYVLDCDNAPALINKVNAAIELNTD